jgi:hypothetical protein
MAALDQSTGMISATRRPTSRLPCQDFPISFTFWDRTQAKVTRLLSTPLRSELFVSIRPHFPSPSADAGLATSTLSSR